MFGFLEFSVLYRTPEKSSRFSLGSISSFRDSKTQKGFIGISHLNFRRMILIKRQWLCVWKEGTQFCLYTCSRKYHFLSLLLWQEYPHPRLGNRQSLFCFLGSEQPCFSIHLQSSFLIIPNPAQTFWIVVASLDSIKILKRQTHLNIFNIGFLSLKTLFCNEAHSSLNLILGSSPHKTYSNLELYFQNNTRILVSNICCLET